jgi:hypothetical protein
VQADERVSTLLDTTIIGAFERVRLPTEESQSIEHEITLFSQHVASCGTNVALTPGEFKQAQVSDAANVTFYFFVTCIVSGSWN